MASFFYYIFAPAPLKSFDRKFFDCADFFSLVVFKEYCKDLRILLNKELGILANIV